jgi:2-polyprenyl-6-hydroxyphenyl methylase / 3-demethylubiquinone-9 3-methyltransferase
MAKAMAKTQNPHPQSSIKPEEAAHFGGLAAEWWDPKGTSAMLHRLNPARLGYIRAKVNGHFGCDPAARHPLAGKRAIDVGCGAGLIAEPLARMGAETSAVDAAPENIAAAQAHAAGQSLTIDYRHGDVTNPALRKTLGKFDLVTCLEVLEHVADPAAFVAALADVLAPGGLIILSTPNRTLQSKLLLVGAAEILGSIPRGTHDWDAFLTPEDLTALVEAQGLVVVDISGISFAPSRGFVISDNLALNYIVTATR